MLTSQQQMKNFKALTPQEQIEIVVGAIQDLQKQTGQFQDILDRIEAETIDADMAAQLYEVIVINAQEVKNKKAEHHKLVFHKAQAHMHKLLDQEALEREQEQEEADSLLESLE